MYRTTTAGEAIMCCDRMQLSRAELYYRVHSSALRCTDAGHFAVRLKCEKCRWTGRL